MTYTPLHKAAQQGKVEALEKLWQENSYSHKHLNDQHNEDQFTPLLCALIYQQWKAAEWLINKGAWIDVADIKGFSPLKKITNLSGWEKNKAVISLIVHLLQKRTFFQKERIEAAVKYVVEQGLDQETRQRKPLSQKAYHQHLCKAVTGLLGKKMKDFQSILLKRDFYEAASKNRKSEERENIEKKIDYTTGLATSEFLPYRIALVFDVLVRLQQGDLSNQLPEKTEEETYKPKEIYKAGLQELQTQLTTFWSDRILTNIFLFSLQQIKNCYQAWATGILGGLPSLSASREISLALSDTGHCIYVSLTQIDDRYIVRVDNRQQPYGSKNKHPQASKTIHNKQMKCLQPYLVAYFPVQAWEKHKAWLLNYITGAGQLNGHYASKVRSHLYQDNEKAPKEGIRPSWVSTWPWRPLQIDADNCFMRSHNVGYRIRLGNDLYKWFRQKSSTSYLLERQFIEDQLGVSSSDKGPKLKGGPTTGHHSPKDNINKMGSKKKKTKKVFNPDEEERKEESPKPKKIVHKVSVSPSKSSGKQQGSRYTMVNKKDISTKKLGSKKTKYRSYKQSQPENTNYVSPQKFQSKKIQPKKSFPKQRISSKKLPSHQEVMQRFAQQLNVNYDAVYSGIAAEQALVRYAGITATQTGAMFRRDGNTGYTWFKLKLTRDEAKLFVRHYKKHHPKIIKKGQYLDNGWVHITFDTQRLYDEVIPKLS